MNAHQIVEAVLFASYAPLTADEIARADEMLDEDQVDALAVELRARRRDDDLLLLHDVEDDVDDVLEVLGRAAEG